MIDLPVLDQEAERQDDGDRYWRSLAQLHNDPELASDAKEEFLPGASDGPGKASRRQFLQLMGASMALAGLTACRRPVDTIVPYTRQPEEIVPGIPLQYATAVPFRGVLRPLLVQSHEGRPTKVEGNPEHPMSRGATTLFEQAEILNLYDPDRSQRVLRNGEEATWADFVEHVNTITEAGAARVAVLAEATSSPTVGDLRDQLRQRFPDLRWVTYREEGDDNESFGLQEAFGRPVRPLYNFEEAEVIVSLDADFLSATDRNQIYNARQFGASRRLTSERDSMNRLYVVESQFSVTGGMADNRLRLRASDISQFAAALGEEMGVGSGAGSAAGLDDRAQEYVREIARDLQQAGSRGVVLAGDTQPPAVHALCAAINGALGSIGEVVTMLDTEEEASNLQSADMQELMQDIRGGLVDVLIMIGVNPAYSASPELEFEGALGNVETTIHLGRLVDETARLAQWHIPRSHAFEAWGDGRAYDGTLSVIQPLIAPLYDTSVSDIELLAFLATGEEESGHDVVRRVWQERLGGGFDDQWRRLLHDGFLPDSAFSSAGGGAPAAAPADFPVAAREELEVVFRLDCTVLDGSFANNAWCQEFPDPVTKLVWDNVAAVSPATAERFDLHVRYDRGRYDADVVRLTSPQGSVDLPVWIVPGHPDDSVTVHVGYGRDISSNRNLRGRHVFDLDHRTDIYNVGAIGSNVGQNVSVLRPATMAPVSVGAISLEKAGGVYTLVTTQEHGSMEGRPIARRATMEEYRENPLFAGTAEETLPDGEPWGEYPTLWQEDHPQGGNPQRESLYYNNQWGMVIDLNACSGCGACAVACQSENNIPVVGKGEVGRGREMHWLRIDRYFVSAEEGSEDEPEMIMQPMLCQHCDNAPCESVCPVAATYQSPDGTNQMIYNRCIGTRYCSNNCPYKVRRFNFFNWTKTLPETVQMTNNPNVTVRSRGVMEKCTFCVQRFRGAQRRANLEERPVRDGEVMTACQQACPSGAITFGDLNDPQSQVNQLKRNNRRYELLAYLNTKPRLSYLGRVSNPNPRLQQNEA